MSAMNRRSLITMLIGVLASIAGLLAATRLRAGRCLERGGQWDDARRACRVAAGVAPETTAQVASAYLVGLLVAVVAGFMLWRLYRLAIGEGPAARR